MTKTFNAAVDLFKAGKRDEAWEMARKDEGMSQDATQDQFTAYVTVLLEKQATTDAANAAEWRD